MVIELSEKLEAALKAQANAHGLYPADYVREVLERELAFLRETKRRMSRSRPGVACSPNTGRHPRLRKSTPIAPTCSATSAKHFDDRCHCRYPYGPLAFI